MDNRFVFEGDGRDLSVGDKVSGCTKRLQQLQHLFDVIVAGL